MARWQGKQNKDANSHVQGTGADAIQTMNKQQSAIVWKSMRSQIKKAHKHRALAFVHGNLYAAFEFFGHFCSSLNGRPYDTSEEVDVPERDGVSEGEKSLSSGLTGVELPLSCTSLGLSLDVPRLKTVCPICRRMPLGSALSSSRFNG